MIDIPALVARGYESKDLDYKGPMAWDEKDKKACCEIVKDCLAMANTEGGYLVIGVSEDSSHLVLDGLSEEQARTWETTRLNNFIKSYADPPINTIMKSDFVDGHRVVVIAIPKFSEVPHVCKRDFPKVLRTATFYVRTDANASEPLGTAADAHALIEHAVRMRSDQLLQSMQLVLRSGGGSPSVDDADQYALQVKAAKDRLRELVSSDYRDRLGREYDATPIMHSVIYPSDFDSERLPLEELSSVAGKARFTPPRRHSPFLFPEIAPYSRITFGEDFIEVYDVQLGISVPVLGYWRLYRSGLLFHSLNIYMGSMRSGTLYINGVKQGTPSEAVSMRWLADAPGLAADCLVRLLRQFTDDTDTGTLQIEVANVDGIGLVEDMTQLPVGGEFVCQIPTIPATMSASLAEWKASYIEFAAEISQDILLRFQYQYLSKKRIEENLERVFSRRLT